MEADNETRRNPQTVTKPTQANKHRIIGGDMKYRIWQKVTRTGEFEVVDDARILSVENVKEDDTGEEFQMVTYIVPIK